MITEPQTLGETYLKALNEDTLSRWAKLRQMTAKEYRDQLIELVEWAGSELPEAESDKVLMEVFHLIYTRLGFRVETKIVKRAA